MNTGALLGTVLRSALGVRRKRSHRALDFLVGRRSGAASAEVLMTAAGLAWGAYEAWQAGANRPSPPSPPSPTAAPPSTGPVPPVSPSPSDAAAGEEATTRLLKLAVAAANADGSLAEMCGNGVRVFVHALIAEGRMQPGAFAVATRGGVRHVSIDVVGGDVAVDMGVGEPLLPSSITIGEGETFPAAGMLFPNPHAVVFVDSLDDAGDLLDVPAWQPTERYPNGVNVEFVRFVGPRHIEMRVHERGIGETLSCGTGICAAVNVARDAEQETGAATWTVDLPGGRVSVQVTADGATTLRGPAVLVGEFDIDEEWLRREA